MDSDSDTDLLRERKHEMSDLEGVSLLSKQQIKNRPSAQSLIENDPDWSGWVQKRHLKCGGFCGMCFSPVWKSRFLVVKGGYVFRFASERSKKPKGIPLPLETLSIEPEPEGVLVLTSLVSMVAIRISNKEQREDFLKAIFRSKTRSIKGRLGHVELTESERAAHKAGDEIFEQNIRAKTEAVNEATKMFADRMGMSG